MGLVNISNLNMLKKPAYWWKVMLLLYLILIYSGAIYIYLGTHGQPAFIRWVEFIPEVKLEKILKFMQVCGGVFVGCGVLGAIVTMCPMNKSTRQLHLGWLTLTTIVCAVTCTISQQMLPAISRAYSSPPTYPQLYQLVCPIVNNYICNEISVTSALDLVNQNMSLGGQTSSSSFSSFCTQIPISSSPGGETGLSSSSQEVATGCEICKHTTQPPRVYSWMASRHDIAPLRVETLLIKDCWFTSPSFNKTSVYSNMSLAAFVKQWPTQATGLDDCLRLTWLVTITSGIFGVVIALLLYDAFHEHNELTQVEEFRVLTEEAAARRAQTVQEQAARRVFSGAPP